MYNHFFSTLANLEFKNYDDGISDEFVPKSLSGVLLDIYYLLYPRGSSRLYCLFLTDYYIKLIQTARFDSVLQLVDSRLVSYPRLDNWFRTHKISNVVGNTTNFAVTVLGRLENNVADTHAYKGIIIDQLTNTLNLTVKSKYDNQSYYSAANPVTLIFDGVSNKGVSQVVPIGRTGLSFYITANAGFDTTSAKQWEFIAEAPYSFDFSTWFKKLKNNQLLLDRMLLLPDTVTNKEYDPLWLTASNDVTKAAAILVAYVSRILSSK